MKDPSPVRRGVEPPKVELFPGVGAVKQAFTRAPSGFITAKTTATGQLKDVQPLLRDSPMASLGMQLAAALTTSIGSFVGEAGKKAGENVFEGATKGFGAGEALKFLGFKHGGRVNTEASRLRAMNYARRMSAQ
jgi:hypothetical protein